MIELIKWFISLPSKEMGLVIAFWCALWFIPSFAIAAVVSEFKTRKAG